MFILIRTSAEVFRSERSNEKPGPGLGCRDLGLEPDLGVGEVEALDQSRVVEELLFFTGLDPGLEEPVDDGLKDG